MRIYLLVSGEARRDVRAPFVGADHAVADGCCPKCGAKDFRIAGTGRYPSKDERAWEAQAVCLACREPVGLIRAETETLFGVREDEAVLNGRCRVY